MPLWGRCVKEIDMRGVVASQQAAIEYLLEKVRIYEDKIKESTGKKRGICVNYNHIMLPCSKL